MPGHFVLLNKACAQEKLFYQSLTYLGEGIYPTPAHSSHPVPPKIGGCVCETIVKFMVQAHRLTIDGLRPYHRTTEYFLFSHTLPSLKAYLLQFPLPSTSCSAMKKKIRQTKSQKTVWSETGWDPGPFAAVLQCLHLDTPLLEQQNTKKPYGTKNNCMNAQLGQIMDRKIQKTEKPNCHF